MASKMLAVVVAVVTMVALLTATIDAAVATDVGGDATAGAVSNPFVYPFTNDCMGELTLYKHSLPCPDTCTRDCIYVISLKASSWSWFEGNPNFDFVIFETFADFDNWNRNKAFNYTHGEFMVTVFNVTLYVPPGSNYIFAIYNTNWFCDGYLNGMVEFYPNTLPGDSTNQPGVMDAGVDFSAKAMERMGLDMDTDASFAMGFAYGLVDAMPFATPMQKCLNAASGLVQQAEQLMVAARNITGLSSAITVLQNFTSIFENHMTLFNDCPSQNQCPGWAQTLLMDAIKAGITVLEHAEPQYTEAIEFGSKVVKILIDGVDIYHSIDQLLDAEEPALFYKRGFFVGRLAVDLKNVVDHVGDSRRRRSISEFNLRNNDGVVRSLAEWRGLYGRM